MDTSARFSSESSSASFGAGALVAQLIEPDITQDGEQPAFHVAVGTKTFLCLQSAKIGFLHEIRSHRGVTAEHHSIGIKAIHVSGKSCIAPYFCKNLIFWH